MGERLFAMPTADPLDRAFEQSMLNQEVATRVKGLREAFSSGLTRPVEHRLAQLKSFQQMMKDNCDRWTEALFKDLHKSKFEAYNMEVNPVEHELQYHIDHLAKSIAPTSLSMDPFEHLVISMTGHGKAALYWDPLGVCLIIGAWNYPLHLTLLPVVGAIAAGNAVCIKTPSPKYSPHTAALIAELVPKYLEHVIVVEGGAEGTQAVLAPADDGSKQFDHIFFTGGSTVGKLVAQAAARDLVPTVLELGGKSPVIVDQSANLSVAAQRIMWGKFTNAGQTCVAADHLFVHQAVAEEFVEECKKAIISFYGEKPQESPDLARIINARAWDRLAGVVTDGKAVTKLGGEMDRDNLYIAPTLLDYGNDIEGFNNSQAMADEIFGPILPIAYYSDLDDIINRINASEKPLAMYIFANDTSVSERMLKETSAGHAVVNDILLQFCAPLPFGGVGNSGMGNYHKHWSFRCFSHEKGVLKRHVYGEIPARFPPYGVPWKTFLVSTLTFPFSAKHVKLMKIVFAILLLRFTRIYSWTAPIVKALLMKIAGLL